MKCPSCGAGSADSMPCFDCTNRLLSDLRTIGELWPATMERRVTGEKGPIGKGGSHGLSAIPEKRKEQIDQVRNTLGTWMREFDADVPDDVSAWCEWLVRHVPEMRSHPAADELMRDVSGCWHTVTHLADIPADREFVGFCPTCGDWMYAKPKAVEVVCRKCKAAGIEPSKHAVGVARENMLTEAKTYRGTPLEVSRLVGVSSSTLRGWVRKGWLPADDAGQVEIGQALLLAETMTERMEHAG